MINYCQACHMLPLLGPPKLLRVLFSYFFHTSVSLDKVVSLLKVSTPLYSYLVLNPQAQVPSATPPLSPKAGVGQQSSGCWALGWWQ